MFSASPFISYAVKKIRRPNMRGVMRDPSQRKQRERHSGPPCPHYPHKFKTEAAHQAKLAARRRNHKRMRASSLDYRLHALLVTINHRCNSPKHCSYRWYGGRGIKNFLTFEDVKFLWFRDGAWAMKRPTIDRRECDGDYTFDNCRFIPHADNVRRAIAYRDGKPDPMAALRA